MGKTRKSKPSTFTGHDHTQCVQQIMTRATEAFEESGMRLTGLRRSVLEKLTASHRALGAYEVLDRLAADGGKRLAPISVYRAIDALREIGVVHRLETRNAFFACAGRHDSSHRQVVLACEKCGEIAEVEAEAVLDAIDGVAGARGFAPGRLMIEVLGTCSACSVATSAA